MTSAQKNAAMLRWGLFAVWVSCLGFGIFCLLAIFFDIEFFGAGLVGAPQWALLGSFENILGKLHIDSILGGSDLAGKIAYGAVAFIYVTIFFLSQWFFLNPRRVWKMNVQPSGRQMKKAAIGVAFAVMLLSLGFLYTFFDLIDFKSKFEGDAQERPLVYTLLIWLPLFLWLVWSVVFWFYLRQGDYYTRAGKVIRALIAGSILESFMATAVFATRHDDCYCARGSYAGLVFGATALLWAFGPGVFFLFLREKRRRDQLS